MVNITRQFADTVNRYWTIYQVLDELLKHDYEKVKTGNFCRIVPCPVTDSEQNAFSIWEDNKGIQHYKAWSTNYCDPIWDELPETGTAADLIACLAKDQTEIVKICRRHDIQPISFGHRAPTKNEKQHKTCSELEAIFDEWEWKMKTERINWIPALQYFCDTRFFKEATVKHFNIGYKGPTCENDNWYHRFSYPFYLDGRLQHIKYKIIEKEYDGTFKTSQEGNNSGGDYFFNEQDLYDKEKIILCEGEHDAMRIWESITRHSTNYGVVATSGNISELKWKKLKESNRSFILAFDNDEAGKKYEQKSILQNLKIIGYLRSTDPTLKDPDEWLFMQKGTII